MFALLNATRGVSLFTLTAISVDRFLALHYDMGYLTLMTTTRAIYIFDALWFITFFAFITNFVGRAQ